ncbi:MAG: site-specific integrase [Thermoguttaceae bacterium]|nr:site-specific integrase [Thermoguttaceae bacterium]
MASLQERKRKNGKSAHLIQFVLKGRRRSVFLGVKNPKRVAQELSFFIDSLVAAVEYGTTPERRVLNWVENLDEELRQRLGRAGLIAVSNPLTLAELIDLYLEAEAPSLKASTLRGKKLKFRQAALHMDFSILADRLSVADATRLKTELEKTVSPPTRTGILKAMARVYSWGMTMELVAKNPFAQVPKGSFINKSKEHFVPLDVYRRVVTSCDDAELRALFALYRIGGLRFSEAFEARWEDVDWEGERFTVRSPKTAKSGKDRRVIPLFTELRRQLETLRSQKGVKSTGLIATRYTSNSTYSAIRQMIMKAGVPLWERLIQNLRSSRANEIYREFGELAESAWIGHSARTAQNHYLHLLESDFEKAIKGDV